MILQLNYDSLPLEFTGHGDAHSVIFGPQTGLHEQWGILSDSCDCDQGVEETPNLRFPHLG